MLCKIAFSIEFFFLLHSSRKKQLKTSLSLSLQGHRTKPSSSSVFDISELRGAEKIQEPRIDAGEYNPIIL